MNKIMRSTIVLIAFCFSTQSFAALSPVGLSIVPPVQFPPSDFSVTGARLSVLWGNHRDVYGVDLGLIGNVTEQSFVGVGLSGLFNKTKGQTVIIGLQGALGWNYNVQKTDVFGLQFAAVNINVASSSVNGVQFGLANLADHTVIRGAQVGIYNKAQDVYGLQIGIVNVASSLHGIQIGILNFHDKGMFKVSPIINVGF